ncbi:SGNH/GDSL hydrolase family protein [Schleiferilactobacillus perolens]|uniref:SGNH hydrolase-type esterase domain-containing protein n=1 Tax=Schleiferilactobacillus perolens DSM 12744 TaxID=1423792 RepID=A0A0R1MVZ1_9LACO|nr:SGNH/GDSL hydrolase family protein [Schleiferilactobacillus perolens]KRL12359.1 hypothetical protein FD09_GL002939 [Schleiferilactobacillus perolens DSM 12744]
MRRPKQPPHHPRRILLALAAVLFALAGVIAAATIITDHAAEWGLTTAAPAKQKTTKRAAHPLQWSDFTAQRPLVYTALGDSLAQGYFATAKNKGYVYQLQNLIQTQRQVPVKVHNFSENGGSITTVAFPQLAEIDATKPDLVTIEFGTNESVYDDPPASATPTEFADHLRQLIQDLQAHTSAKIILVTTWHQPRSETYDARVHQVAKEFSLPVADLTSIWKNADKNGAVSEKGAESFLGYGDGFHPSDTGHLLIARKINTQVAKLFNP